MIYLANMIKATIYICVGATVVAVAWHQVAPERWLWMTSKQMENAVGTLMIIGLFWGIWKLIKYADAERSRRRI